MRKLFNGSLMGGGAALAVAIGCSFAGLSRVLAEEPAEQRIIVLTSDEDDGKDGDEKKELHAHVTVVHGPKRWLGIMLKDIEGDLARYLDSEEGILVDSVIDDSPAAKAGIQEGDVLLSVGDTKLSEPKKLMEVMSGLDEKGASLEITLLRKGEKKTVEVTPTPRPNMDEVAVREVENLHLDLKDSAEAGEAVKKALRQLRVGELDEDMNILRFGNPSMIFRGRDKTATIDGNLEAIIVREVDGEKTEVKVVRKEDGPVTVTVTQGDETTEYSEKNLDEMPEEISVIVEPLVEGKSELRIGGRFQVVGPKWADIEVGNLNREEIVKKAREMAERGRDLAAESVDKARLGQRLRSAGAAEIDELKAMIDELRGEIDKLRAELKDKN